MRSRTTGPLPMGSVVGVFEALRDVLVATPEPPADADPSDIVNMAQDMADRRAIALGRLQALLSGDAKPGEDCAPLLAEIRDRDARWNAVLTRARDEIVRRAAAVRRVRHHRGY